MNQQVLIGDEVLIVDEAYIFVEQILVVPQNLFVNVDNITFQLQWIRKSIEWAVSGLLSRNFN